jgi:FixJ family two-component response regulator
MISVVDDDPSVRAATADLLDSAGPGCQSFASAEAFLASGAVARTSCLILDVSMPGLNGIELQQRLTQNGYLIPVIFITAFPSERICAQATASGATCCLLKPYSDNELLRCIRIALGTPREDSRSGT